MAKRLTKADLAAREAHEANLLAALAWPKVSEPEAHSPEKMAALLTDRKWSDPVRAWTFNEYTARVTHGCFSRVHHSTDGAETRSQTQGGPWYDTREEAEIALWWAVCRKCAAEILKVAKPLPQGDH